MFSVCSYSFFDNYAVLFLHSGDNRSMLRYIELVFHTATSLPIGFIKDQLREAFGLIRICQHELKMSRLHQLLQWYSNLLLQGTACRVQPGNGALIDFIKDESPQKLPCRVAARNMVSTRFSRIWGEAKRYLSLCRSIIKQESTKMHLRCSSN